MTKRILTGILSVLLLAGSGVCGATEGDPFPLNKGSAFEYFQDNIPDIFFFPAAKARWNGDKVTAKQWPMLTDYQKTMFISECAREVEKRSGREITIDGWKYIIALNGFAEEACRDVCLPQPMTQVLGDLLAEAEKA